MPDVSRTVTFLTSDLQGSTALAEKLDPETLREVLDLYFDDMRLVFESHGAIIEKIIGDAILAVFGLGGTRDDHALEAVRAAAEGQEALHVLNARLDDRWGVQLVNRTGIATGPLVVRAASADEHILTGDVIQRSGRLEQAAPPLEVLLDEATYAAASSSASIAAEPFQAKPKNPATTPDGAPVFIPAFRLGSVGAPSGSPDGMPTGTVTGRMCSNCGSSNPDNFRHCGSCGAQLVLTRATERRKIVTIVFAFLDTQDSGGDPLTSDVQREVMARAFDASRTALVRHGGTIEKFIGDAVMAVFGLPARHEDDALRAVRAALDMRAGLAALADTLRQESAIHFEVAIGVNTGEVITGEASLGQRLVTGDAVNVAARLEQAAAPGEILVGDLTARLVRDRATLEQVASLTLKGKSEPVPAHRVLGVQGGSIPTSAPTTAMVGREAEMRLLTDSFDTAAAERVCRIVTLVGDAGVGKTRLSKEFLEAASARGRIVGGRCLPYGDGITFWPIVELVQGAAGLLDTDTPAKAIRKLRRLVGGDRAVVDRVAAAVGLRDAPFQIGELFWGIRRFLEILAAGKPLIVVFDDIHWAEPTLLDLLGHLTANVHGEPILLLCMARNELLEKQPEWGRGPDEGLIVLSPLSDADAEQVVDNLLGEIRLAEAVRARVVTAAEGNPLFVEQLVSMLKETGKLRLVDDRWEPAGDLSTLEIPPTIHALLAARIDQLPDAERATIDPASVIGLVFPTGALQAIVDDVVRDEVPERLDALATRQLVRPAEPAASDNFDYRFTHLMIRDAAYAGLLKRTRARLHERFVGWADEVNRAADRATEFEEILGYHLEQAHRNLAELGSLDGHAAALGIDASERLASAGQRAFVRGDMPATANLVRRAVALLPDTHPARPGLLFQLGLALTEIGEARAADVALAASTEAAAALGDRGLAETARLERLMVQYISDPSKVEGDIEARIRASIVVLEDAHDEGGLARAWLSIGQVDMVAGRWGRAAQAFERVIEHARRAGDRVLEVRTGPNLAFCARFGPMPVPEAIALCEEIMRRSSGDQKAESVTLRTLASLHAKRGEFDLARDEYRRARSTLEGLGWTFNAALTSIDSGPIEMLAGDPVAAEAELRHDYETLDRLGERNFISTVAAYLAEALWRQDRIADATAMAGFSAGVAAPDDIPTQVALRRVRGKILSREGRLDEAISTCREGVELTRGEDDPTDQAEALADLALVLRAAGEQQAAQAAAVEALALHRAKGNSVAGAEVAQFLAESPPVVVLGDQRA